MRPSLPPFALLAGPIDTAGNARAAVEAIPAGVATAEAAATALSAEMSPLLRALHNPSPRAFRLALAALTPALDVTSTAH
eukprot:2221674-Rhodomonas_salina.1